MIDLSFSFVGECWLWQSTGTAWHFISLPQDKSEEIKFFDENLHEKRRGWGAVRVLVTIGNTSSKQEAYILPIKADVRKKEKIAVGDSVKVKLKINI
jgi:Domain of unknown function (DUF1905)